MKPLRIFIGFDDRQIAAYTALQMSLLMTAKKPLAITPLVLETLPIKRRGLTPFTFSRFLVPWLCNYEGPALFMDSDMLCLSDISELFDRNDGSPVMVVKNRMRFEWASLMLFNCNKCRSLTPSVIDDQNYQPMKLEWATSIGELPAEWNHLVGYDEPVQSPKLLHYTQGIPCHEETRDGGYRDQWMQAANIAMSSKPWLELMGTSVHYPHVMERLKRAG